MLVFTQINQRDFTMKDKKPPRKHIKMYGNNDTLQSIKEQAEIKGISQSTYILIAVSNQLKKECK